MDRKSFLKKSALSAIAISGAQLAAKSTRSSSPEASSSINQVGYNHLPNNEIKTMKTVLHKANTRGHANHGWLDTHHSFSFANYYNPERMNFGVLRVLNDDQVSGGKGFGTHPHNNMEIISIPLEGDLEHKDSMGNTAVIKEGDVQIMSAGTGVYHSEYNRNASKAVKFLQIWMFPNKQGVTPRYDQISLESSKMTNNLLQILSPNKEDEGVWAHQNAWFHIGNFDTGKKTSYDLKDVNNGVYVFVLQGNIFINGQALEQRDGLGVWETQCLELESTTSSKVLLMEVPMEL